MRHENISFSLGCSFGGGDFEGQKFGPNFSFILFRFPSFLSLSLSLSLARALALSLSSAHSAGTLSFLPSLSLIHFNFHSLYISLSLTHFIICFLKFQSLSFFSPSLDSDQKLIFLLLSPKLMSLSLFSLLLLMLLSLLLLLLLSLSVMMLLMLLLLSQPQSFPKNSGKSYWKGEEEEKSLTSTFCWKKNSPSGRDLFLLPFSGKTNLTWPKKNHHINVNLCCFIYKMYSLLLYSILYPSYCVF